MRRLSGSLVALLVLAGPVLAARPDVRKMTCDQARSLVLQRGAVVMTTGQYTYKRFVSRQSYCDYWERAASAWTATRDDPQCRIGYVCEERMNRFPFGRLHRR